MKYLKLTDLLGQTLVTLYLLLFYPESGTGFFLWLFIMGGWQVLSCGLHVLFIRHSDRTDSRKGYEIALLVVVVAGVPLFPVIFMILLYLGPLLAAWYWFTCLYETSHLFFWRGRPLDQIR